MDRNRVLYPINKMASKTLSHLVTRLTDGWSGIGNIEIEIFSKILSNL